MPKFYVSSGDLRAIVSEPTAKEAAISALAKMGDVALSKLIVVSEKGFDSFEEDDLFYCTVDLLEESGQLNEFCFKTWS